MTVRNPAVFPDFGTVNTQPSHRSNILSITNALPCQITTSSNHGFTTNSYVRLTNLNFAKNAYSDMYPLLNSRYRIIVNGLTTFTLQDPITHDPIDSTNYPPYLNSGYCTLVQDEYIYYST